MANGGTERSTEYIGTVPVSNDSDVSQHCEPLLDTRVEPAADVSFLNSFMEEDILERECEVPDKSF